jgi:hypothetical protein
MKEKIISKSVWGPKAWHLLHAFSIHPSSEITQEEQHFYYLFYKTFYYIIPCQICKIHYRDILDIFEPLDEKKITRKSLKIWVWKIHNKVNERLGKKKMEYQKAMEMQKPLQNKEIFYFINHIFFQMDEKSCCISDFDHIYHFFYVFAKLYPDKKIRKKIISLIESNDFGQISTPKDLREWYIQHYQEWQS